MSPVLLDSRAPEHTSYVLHHDGYALRKPIPNGQISIIFSLIFSGLFSINQSKAMNSSNANSEPSRFPYSNEITSDIGLNEPGLGSEKPAFGSASGRPKPRMMKLRRHAASNHPRSTLPPKTGKIDSGFNQFPPILDNSIPSFPLAEIDSSASGNLNFGNAGNEAFVFGSSREKLSTDLNSNTRISSGFVTNKVLDDMRKLKIQSEQEFASTNSPVLNLNDGDKEISSCEGGVEESASFTTGKIDSGFNPFRPISDNSIPSFPRTEIGSSASGNLNFGNAGNEAFVFGTSQEKSSNNLNSNTRISSGFVANKVLDDMRKLKIRSEQEFASTNSPVLNLNDTDREISSREGGIDESASSKLPEEIRKLNIKDSGNVESSKNVRDVNSNLSGLNKTHFIFGSAGRVAHSFGTSLPSALPNELEKLNIKDVGEVDRGSLNYSSDNMKKFVFADVSKDSTSLAGSSESILPAKMKNLNLNSANNYSSEKKEVNFSARNKSDFVFRSNRGDSGNLDGRGESMLSDEMVKLRMARQAGLSTSQGKTGFGSSTLFVKEKLGNLGDEKFLDAWNSIPYGRYNDYAELHGTTASSTFSSSGVHFQPVGNIIEVPSVERPEKKDGLSFTNSWNGLGMSHVEFTTPNQRGNIFTGLDKKLEFNAKMDSATGARSKKKREKLKKSTSAQKWVGQEFVSSSSSQEHPDSFESYSPMEVSPYQETLADNNGSRETSVTSEEAFHLHIDNASSYSHPTVPTDATEEDLVVATQRLNIDEGEMKSAETNVEGSEYRFGRSVGAEAPSEESVWGDETGSFISAAEQLDYNFDTFVTAPDTEVSSSLRFEKDSDGSTQFSCASALASASEASSSSRIERQDSDGSTQFSFASALECVGGTSFAFAASSSAQRQSATAVRHRKKKNRAKVFHESYSSTSNTKVPHTSSSIQFFPPSDTPSLLSPRRGQKGDPPTLFSKKGDKSEAAKEQETKQSSTPDATIAAQEACEKWRLRGNQAYTNGDMSKAEDYYTQGVNCVSQNENSTGCLRALMLCYSNRAATRMSLGRMREALADCMKAAAIDPSFLRVQVRAANCYLALGEVEDASLHFIKCLQSGSEACMDRKLVLEASEGLEKTQKVSECMKQSTELLQRRTSSGAESALGVIAQALTISSYAEKLLEMKADALFMLRKYEELIQLCERTLGSAEMNCPATTADGHLTTLDCSDVQKNPSFRLWRWHLIIKSYFCLGRLEEALDFLKKREGPVSTTEKSEGKSLESLIPLAGTIQELVRRKAAGNEAFQSGRHAEAVEHYTAALSCTVESRPFAAVCFCNRAAALKAMGQIVDAIADCSLAMALDGNYLKAISRRATLFEMIRDYEQATMDLHRLISLLMKQVDDKTNQSGASDRISSMNELRQAQQRLSAIEEEARKEISLNMYLILGVDPSVSVSEIKKAYRKAALRHHPDKACQSLARSENGDDGMWKEVVEEVHKDADRLFKMIGEAYAVLSDPTKRSRYDLEEEMRNTQKRGNGGSGTSKMHTDVQSYPFESNSRRQWQEIWRSYGNSQSRASETTRSSRYS